MKTTLTLILATVFTLHISTVFAGNNETDANNIVPVRAMVLNNDISFTTPLEATFEEVNIFNLLSISDFAPIVPAEADFSDMIPENGVDFSFLAPEIPMVADFNDAEEIPLPVLNPSIPMEADFEVL